MATKIKLMRLGKMRAPYYRIVVADSRTKREGLLSSYGFTDGDGTAYFRVHERRDAEHAAQARELLAELASEGDEDRLVAVAEGAYRANWRLLDGV